MNVVIQHLLSEISEALTQRHPEKWEHPTDPDPLRRTIVAAMNERGWAPDGIPGVLPFIISEIEAGRLAAFSVFNDVQCFDVSLIRSNPAQWYISEDAARHIAQSIAPPPKPPEPAPIIEAPTAPKRPQTKQAQMNAQFLQVLKQLKRDPKALPLPIPGKAGVRSEVAKALGVSPSDKGFEHCWSRAFQDGVLANAKKKAKASK